VDEDQIARYSRQILVKQVGGRGQEKLCAAKVAVRGDGLSARVARLYLSAGGSQLSADGEPLDVPGEDVEAGALAALQFQLKVIG
jgi:hypothetical protein